MHPENIHQPIETDIDEFRDAIIRTSGRIKQVGALGKYENMRQHPDWLSEPVEQPSNGCREHQSASHPGCPDGEAYA